jgi:hypothetical protein
MHIVVAKDKKAPKKDKKVGKSGTGLPLSNALPDQLSP